MMHPGKKYSLHLNDNRNTVILSHVVVCIYGSYVYMIQKSSQTVHKTQLRFQDVVGHVPCCCLRSVPGLELEMASPSSEKKTCPSLFLGAHEKSQGRPSQREAMKLSKMIEKSSGVHICS